MLPWFRHKLPYVNASVQNFTTVSLGIETIAIRGKRININESWKKYCIYHASPYIFPHNQPFLEAGIVQCLWNAHFVLELAILTSHLMFKIIMSWDYPLYNCRLELPLVSLATQWLLTVTVHQKNYVSAHLLTRPGKNCLTSRCMDWRITVVLQVAAYYWYALHNKLSST